MYVCICHAVDEQELRSHIADGACTTRHIAQRSRAGTGCGMCVRRIACLLGEARMNGARISEPPRAASVIVECAPAA